MIETILEWTGACTGLACVVLTVKRRVSCWPVGLVSVVAYAAFFFRLKLYADAGLQVFFFATGLLGWWYWARGGAEHSGAPIQILRPQENRAIGCCEPWPTSGNESCSVVGRTMSLTTRSATSQHYAGTTRRSSLGSTQLAPTPPDSSTFLCTSDLLRCLRAGLLRRNPRTGWRFRPYGGARYDPSLGSHSCLDTIF
jgi:hypothetical protein